MQQISRPSEVAIEIRHGDDRGRTEFDWLKSRHSFSFGRYIDHDRIAFRSLRVLNEDIVAPGGGFPMHSHENMEIITWVLSGALAHRDSTGTSGIIRPGDVQVMSAGRGIEHSEMNASDTEPVHLLQIWIIPEKSGIEPSYAQRSFDAAGRENSWQTLVSVDEREGSLRIHQNAILSVADLDSGTKLDAVIEADRFGYLHVATGAVRIGEMRLRAGDALTFTGGDHPKIEAIDAALVLLFDLA